MELNLIQKFSAKDETVKTIKENLEKIAKYSMYHGAKTSLMADKTFALVDSEIKNYDELNEKTKKALLAFCADKAGIEKIETKADILRAFSNPTFANIFNSIIV